MELELGQLITLIGKSVSEAQQTIQAHAAENYFSYFQHPPDSNNAALEAKITAVLIPRPDGESSVQVDVPLAAMVNHNPVALDSVRLNLHLPIASAGAGGVIVDLGRPQDNQEVPASAADMELRFQCGAPAEGIARIGTELNKFL